MVERIKSFITKVRLRWLVNRTHRKILKQIKKDFHLKSNKDAEKQYQRIIESIYEVFSAIEENIDNGNADGI